jgi:hypothetical protein
MRVKMNLKGINWVKRTLADGSIKEYAYLGRGVGAMRLEGGRDSPEEIERLIGSYQRAKAEHRPTNANTLKGIITAYMQSPDTKLSPRTPQQISPITGIASTLSSASSRGIARTPTSSRLERSSCSKRPEGEQILQNELQNAE